MTDLPSRQDFMTREDVHRIIAEHDAELLAVLRGGFDVPSEELQPVQKTLGHGAHLSSDGMSLT